VAAKANGRAWIVDVAGLLGERVSKLGPQLVAWKRQGHVGLAHAASDVGEEWPGQREASEVRDILAPGGAWHFVLAPRAKG
jgi:hypothetical protein